MKKSRILAAIIIWSLMATLTGAAMSSNSMNVSVTYQDGAEIGDTLDVQVEVSGADATCAVQFALGYNDSVLDCLSITTGPALSGMMSATNPDASDGARIAAASATGIDINGVVATLQFRVIGSGSYDFTIGDAIFADEGGNEYAFTLEGAAASSPDSPSTPTPSVTEPPASEPPETEQPEPSDEPESEESAFTDIVGHWAESYINEAAGLGLINGMDVGIYAPDSTMTRAQFVTILWRSQGSPEPNGTSSFTDLGAGSDWFSDAVAWAEENQVVDGVDVGKFDPNGQVTREQIATILFRMSGDEAENGQQYADIYEQAFTDSVSVGSWAKEAVWWAVYHEIWCGTDSTDVGTVLAPTQAADRAQIAVMMVRYLDYVEGVQE